MAEAGSGVLSTDGDSEGKTTTPGIQAKQRRPLRIKTAKEMVRPWGGPGMLWSLFQHFFFF